MKVNLAGFNIDAEILAEDINYESKTPETIAAAYARISRENKPVDELRKIARHDIEKSRQSNKTIVYDMGHNSIAEHAVFNLDIIDVSRLLVEEIESHRLCSFTEKSQRYVLFEKDFYIPKEFNDDDKNKYIRLVEKQFSFYKNSFPILKKYFIKQQEKIDEKLAENLAKEDARYIIPLSTYTQLGMTINARNLELMIRRLAESDLLEANELANKLYNKTYNIAPSLIKYTQPNPVKVGNNKEIKRFLEKFSTTNKHDQRSITEDLDLSSGSLDITRNILHSLFFTNTKLSTYEIDAIIDKIPISEIVTIFMFLFHNLEIHDELPREFESYNFTFFLTLSASCFAQLKRHRMCTILAQNYDPNLLNIIPDSIICAGDDRVLSEYLNIIDQSRKFYETIQDNIRNYILPNCTCRRVKLIMNLRSFYHFCRLRLDKHAQWEIRKLAKLMFDDLLSHGNSNNNFASLQMICGKDQFYETKNKIYAHVC